MRTRRDRIDLELIAQCRTVSRVAARKDIVVTVLIALPHQRKVAIGGHRDHRGILGATSALTDLRLRTERHTSRVVALHQHIGIGTATVP